MLGRGTVPCWTRFGVVGERQSGWSEFWRRADIREGDIEQESEAAWAAVVFWHSLEHLPAPASALATAKKLLLRDGVLIVAVPNSASLQAAAFGDRWFALDLPRHLVHLTSAVLIDRLWSLGLRVERVSYLRGGQTLFGWLYGMVGVLPGHPSLYDAIRRPAARSGHIGGATRAGALALATILFPFALLASVAEFATRRGGTVYVEARSVDV